MTFEDWLRRHPLSGYFALAYGVSWGGILIIVGATGFNWAELQPLDTSLIFMSMLLGQGCLELGIAQKFTRAFRPQTNGKAERFIQSALREWAYGRAYGHSDQRRAALPYWNHFYNWHRQHHGIGRQPPMSRLSRSRKNLLTLHS